MGLSGTEIFPLDRWQVAAVLGEPFALVIGGPGSGKTQLIAAKTAPLLGPRVAPESIACLAVRDEAAGQLRRRIETHPIAGKHVKDIFVGTIDQCANRMLRAAGCEVLGIRPDYSIWGEDHAVEMLLVALNDHPGLPVTGKQQVRAILRWHWRNQGRWPDERLQPPQQGYWLAVVELYRDEKVRQRSLDLYDLPVQALLAMNQDPARMAARNQGRFRHVLLDGAEEMTARQLAFLLRIVDPAGSLMVTADPSQAISPEADPSALETLRQTYPLMQLYPLRGHHRTARRLVRVAATLRNDLDDAGMPDVIPDPEIPEGQSPKLVLVEGILQDLDVHCLQEIQKLHEEGVAWEDMAVLDPRGRAIDRMRTQLLHRGIPHRPLGVPAAPRPGDARCAAALLTSALNPWDLQAMRLGAAAGCPNRERILPAAISRQVRRVAWEQGIDLVTAAGQVGDSLPEKSRDRRSLHIWVTLHKKVEDCLSRPDEDLIRVCGMAEAAVGAGKAKGLVEPGDVEMSRLWDLIWATPPLPGESRQAHLRRFLDRWSEALHPARAYEDQEGVTFGPIGAAKGRAWRSVFLVDVSDESIPGPMGPYSGRLERERRRFYTAVTRATERLYLCCLVDTGRGNNGTLTRFLAPIRHLLEEVRVQHRGKPPPPDPFADF